MIAQRTGPDNTGEDDADQLPVRAPRRRIPVSIVLASAVVAALLSGIIILAVYLLWIRPTPDPLFDPAGLAEARAKWDDHGPASYDLQLSLSVNESRPESIRVEVRDNEPVRVVRNGRELPRREQMDAWTVPGLFETIRRDEEMATGDLAGFPVGKKAQMTMRVAYDPRLGYPLRYLRHFDRSANQIRWTVERLDVVTP